MAEPIKDPNSEESLSHPSKPAKKSSNPEGVVDELRKLLSGLDQEKPPVQEPAPSEAPPIESLDEMEELSGHGLFTKEKKEEEELLRESPPDPSPFLRDEPLATEPSAKAPAPAQEASKSDADFWGGDVLGWSETEGKEPTEKKAPPEPAPADLDETGKNAGTLPEPATETPQPSEPLPEPAFPGFEPAVPKKEEKQADSNEGLESPPGMAPEVTGGPDFQLESILQKEPEPVSPVEPEPESSSSPSAPQTAEVSPDADEGKMFPPLDESTLPSSEEPTEESAPAVNQNSLAHLFEEASSPPEKGAQPEEEAPAAAEPLVSVPGTIEENLSTGTNEKPELDLETARLKPDGVSQVACLFPEGKEILGQKFVGRLREAGRRFRKPLDVQVVFVQAWRVEGLNLEGMERSAALAGADFIFMLVEKNEQELFRDQMIKAGQGEWHGRVVLLEQIELRTLYADILIRLGRKR